MNHVFKIRARPKLELCRFLEGVDAKVRTSKLSSTADEKIKREFYIWSKFSKVQQQYIVRSSLIRFQNDRTYNSGSYKQVLIRITIHKSHKNRMLAQNSEHKSNPTLS